MKHFKLTILQSLLFFSVTTYAQLFNPFGLGIEVSSADAYEYQPPMYVEGDILYVGTMQGLYTRDLSHEGSEWQLAGFEGVPVRDFVLKGDNVFALCFDKAYKNKKDIFLMSHNGGKTYEDVTPENFRSIINKEYECVFKCFAKHPTDSDTFLLSSWGYGIYQTTDFGRTWTKLSNYSPNYIGYHPLNPDIIYECFGGGFTDEKTDIRISYDGGQTWDAKDNCFRNYGYVYRIAFHPTNPDRWVAGGKRSIHLTDDNGKTWKSQDHYDVYNSCLWQYVAYDDEDANIVYAAEGRSSYNMNLMCSTDGGESWSQPYREPIKETEREWIFDMKQYRDKLLLYTQKDVYEVSKSDLLDRSTSVRNIAAGTESFTALYDLTGRRLTDAPKKGLYIKGGKKYVSQ